MGRDETGTGPGRGRDGTGRHGTDAVDGTVIGNFIGKYLTIIG